MAGIHIEGMGWLGAALAIRLERAGLDFTWHDEDRAHNAWRASTGLVFPAGDRRSIHGLRGWARWRRAKLFPIGLTAPAVYCYAHKDPPHGGRYAVADLGWLRAAEAPCYAVDVPAVVAYARKHFANQRRTEAPRNTHLVVAHGYSARLASHMWGWSAPVRLDVPDDVRDVCGLRLPAFYAKAHRFLMVYAYPIPTRAGWWWAGSALVAQQTPRGGDPRAGLDRWRAAFPRLYPRLVLLDAEEPIEGWRPRGTAVDPLGLDIAKDGRITFPPLWHSGVRWAPPLIEAAATRLGAQPLEV